MSPTSTSVDQHGNPMSGDPATVAAYDHALDRLLRFDPAVVPAAMALSDHDDAIPMANVLVAALSLSSTDPGDRGGAIACLDALDAAPANDRERNHGSALRAWADGDWLLAAQRYDDLLTTHPTDLLALMMGHQLDFFRGDARNLRDRPLRSRPEIEPDHPHRGFVDGMVAFGLEESGDYDAAIYAGQSALDQNPDDVWAIHAVVHVHEMRGASGDGVAFLQARTPQWAGGNLFQVHNWWHLALFLLETGDVDAVLALYDDHIHTADAGPVLLEMLDAAALLWRLYLDGEDVGSRFEHLADTWAPKALDEPWYAFNDLHAVVALVGAGRLDDARAVIARLEAFVGSGHGSNVAMTADVGLPSSRAILAFGEERYDAAVDELASIRQTANRFGGSHAQRDLLERTLLEAALRGSRTDLARSLTAERIGLRDTSVYGWMQRSRALRAEGQDADAAEAAARAAALRDALSIG